MSYCNKSLAQLNKVLLRYILQKQPSRAVLRKRCSLAFQFHWNCILALVFFRKFDAYSENTFLSEQSCFWYSYQNHILCNCCVWENDLLKNFVRFENWLFGMLKQLFWECCQLLLRIVTEFEQLNFYST